MGVDEALIVMSVEGEEKADLWRVVVRCVLGRKYCTHMVCWSGRRRRAREW